MIRLPDTDTRPLSGSQKFTSPYKYTAVCKNCGGGIKSVDKKTWVHGNYESLCPRTWAKPRGEV